MTITRTANLRPVVRGHIYDAEAAVEIDASRDYIYSPSRSFTTVDAVRLADEAVAVRELQEVGEELGLDWTWAECRAAMVAAVEAWEASDEGQEAAEGQ